MTDKVQPCSESEAFSGHPSWVVIHTDETGESSSFFRVPGRRAGESISLGSFTRKDSRGWVCEDEDGHTWKGVWFPGSESPRGARTHAWDLAQAAIYEATATPPHKDFAEHASASNIAAACSLVLNAIDRQGGKLADMQGARVAAAREMIDAAMCSSIVHRLLHLEDLGAEEAP